MPATKRPTVHIALGVVAMMALGPGRAPMVRAGADSQGIPPLSYICPMPKDADVVEDKPGKCHKCGMELKPVRLDVAYSCPRHPAIIVGQQGACPIDHQALVQITASLFWTCPGEAEVHELTPGRCGNGQPRVKAYERRAHGDHNPRHGGQLFMADDNWHHLEGTHPSLDIFRVFFYDDYTRPMPAKGFSGTAILLDGAEREMASVPLTGGRSGNALQARITPPAAALRAKVRIRFDSDNRDRTFDFAFPDLTREPVAAITKAAPKEQKGGVSGSSSARPPETPAAAADTRSGGMQMADVGSGNSVLAPREPRPETTAGLVAELRSHRQEIETLIAGGYLGGVWVPAIRSKDIALSLEKYAADLDAPGRSIVAEAIKQIVVSAWQMDAAGDLGDKQKIADAYAAFASAVAQITSTYDAR